ncbi:MAG: hypothetical protein HRF43_06645 [Phycisphaerae bacterium]
MSSTEGLPQRDRVIADTGWGIKPDDQPANAAEAGERARRVFVYDPGRPDVVRAILRAQRQGFNTANRVRVEPHRTVILDINGDPFVVEGLGFGDDNLILLLEALGAAFHRRELRELSGDEKTPPREFALSRVWAWGAERTG